MNQCHNRIINDSDEFAGFVFVYFSNFILLQTANALCFNENLVGWGIDDSEMIQRLHNIGIKGKRLKFAGIAYHIYHKEQSKSHIDINLAIEEETTKAQIKRCEVGINQFLEI